MAQPTKKDLVDSLTKFGVKLSGKETLEELKKLIVDNAEFVENPDDIERDPESPEERVERKAEEAKRGPIAKPKRKLIRPHISALYPWAVNRAKAERAHNTVTSKPETHKLSDEAFEQAVMDEYTAHGGLVRGQEGVTIVGRRGRMKQSFAVGKSTGQILGHDIDDEEEADADEEDDD